MDKRRIGGVWIAGLWCMLMSGCDTVLLRSDTRAALAAHWTHSYPATERLDLQHLVPQVGSDTIYQVDATGMISALAPDTGAVLWTLSLPSGRLPVVGPTVHGTRLYLGTLQGTVYAVDTAHRRVVWESALTAPVQTGIVVQASGPLVYVRTQDGALSALSTETGQVSWQLHFGRPDLTFRNAAMPLEVPEGLLVPTLEGLLVCVDPVSGVMRWEVPIVTPAGQSETERMVDMLSNPVQVAPGRIAVAATGGAPRGVVAMVDAASGKLLWKRQGIETLHNLAVTPKGIVVSTETGELLLLDRDTGRTVWSRSELGTGLSAPWVLSGRIWVADASGVLYGVDPNSGRVRVTLNLPHRGQRRDPLWGVAALSEHRMLLLSARGWLDCVTLPGAS